MEDLTWREKKMRCRIEEIAREEERRGNRVWMGYGRIRINEHWWRWDKMAEVLKDGKGNIRAEGRGDDKEE